jgi:NAD(P)-dependent dehydrogenase (short-subunit alcohol dehydrogenase family)
MARQVVVITGASAGVGRATARAFGRRGARVGLLARGRDGLEALSWISVDGDRNHDGYLKYQSSAKNSLSIKAGRIRATPS